MPEEPTPDVKPDEAKPDSAPPSSDQTRVGSSEATSEPKTETPAKPAASEGAFSPAPAAASQPQSATPAPANDPQIQSNTVTLVWQWLTYGLWTWTLASLSVLLTATLSYFFTKESLDATNWQVYVIATTLCLLPVAYFVDRSYSKKEPEQKHGFAAVILVLHAVLAFLVTIASLITAVVTLLSIATDTEVNLASKLTVVTSAVAIAVLGALFFIRIVQPARLTALSRRFGLIVAAFTAATIVAAIAGPYVASVQSRQDRQIENGLYGVSSSVQKYVRDNHKLPNNLSDLTFEQYYNSSEALVKKNLVEYKKGKETTASASGLSTTSYATNYFYYTLCVTYKQSKGDGKTPAIASDDPYSSYYLSTYNHPAGKVCYDQRASDSTYKVTPVPDIRTVPTQS